MDAPPTRRQTMDIKTLALAVMTAPSLDALKDALEGLQEALQEVYEETGDWNARDLSEVVDLTSLPTWGEEPDSTDGVFSYDNERLLYIEGSNIYLEAREDLDDDSEVEDEDGDND
jgi:hypothetical protein